MSIQLALPFPPEVEWLDIPGYVGIYQVSNTGSVRRLKSHGKLPPLSTVYMREKNTYLRINLSKQGLRQEFSVHRLVMLAFKGEPSKGMDVNHINGIRTDNRLDNLEYCTRKENIRHSIDVLGRSRTGTGNGYAKLKDDDVREIRQLIAIGESDQSICIRYSVVPRTIRFIRTNKTWLHIK